MRIKLVEEQTLATPNGGVDALKRVEILRPRGDDLLRARPAGRAFGRLFERKTWGESEAGASSVVRA